MNTSLSGESSYTIIHNIFECGWASSLLLVDDIGAYSWHVIVCRVFWRIARVIRSLLKSSVIWLGCALTSIWLAAHCADHQAVISITNSCYVLSTMLSRKPHTVVFKKYFFLIHCLIQYALCRLTGFVSISDNSCIFCFIASWPFLWCTTSRNIMHPIIPFSMDLSSLE